MIAFQDPIGGAPCIQSPLWALQARLLLSTLNVHMLPVKGVPALVLSVGAGRCPMAMFM